MPDVNELKNWLKVSDLAKNDIVEIVDGGRIKTFEFEDKITKEKQKGKGLEIGVTVNQGLKRDLTLNKTSIQVLSQEWGNNSDGWVGKKCTVDSMKTMSFGKVTDINFLKPIAWNE